MSSIIVAKARVTFVFRGYGDLTLTDEELVWNKSATSFLTFGVVNALTENHRRIALADIRRIGTYTYYGGGGLLIVDKNGQEFKFSFKHKKDFNAIYGYLKRNI